MGGKRRSRRRRRGLRWMVGALAAVVTLATPLVAAGASVTWSMVPTPDMGGNQAALNSVSCLRDSCTAVGDWTDPSTRSMRTLVERGSVSGWKIVDSPSPGSGDDALLGLSCLSTAFCMAVGSVGETPTTTVSLAEMSDGKRWRVAPTPDIGGAQSSLDSVSCVSPDDCTAVGYSSTELSPGTLTPLVESWNGSTWAVLVSSSSPEPGAVISQLSGVSCVPGGFCAAVGLVSPATGGIQPLAETYDGASWTVDTTPPIANEGMSSVSCVSSSDCIAVGSGGKSLTWDGSSWTAVRVASPGKTVFSDLNGVSCLPSKACKAVGSFLLSGAPFAETLVEAWDGHRWTIGKSPSVPYNDNRLAGVACINIITCKAVGGYETRSAIPSIREPLLLRN